MKIDTNRLLSLCILSLVLLSLICSCDDRDAEIDAYRRGIFTVLSDETTIEIDGDITSSSLDDFNDLYDAFPDVDLISIRMCEGSSDDETNFLLMRRVYQLNLGMHLQDDAVIASGGVDLFLSGRRRSKGDNTRIGTHAWSDDEHSATDFPEDPSHEEHLPYIDSYASIGFSDDEAADLYFFIINSAAAEEIHWMTEEEQELFCFIGDERCSP